MFCFSFPVSDVVILCAVSREELENFQQQIPQFQKSPSDKVVAFDSELIDKYQQNTNASGCQTVRLETPVLIVATTLCFSTG